MSIAQAPLQDNQTKDNDPAYFNSTYRVNPGDTMSLLAISEKLDNNLKNSDEQILIIEEEVEEPSNEDIYVKMSEYHNPKLKKQYSIQASDDDGDGNNKSSKNSSLLVNNRLTVNQFSPFLSVKYVNKLEKEERIRIMKLEKIIRRQNKLEQKAIKIRNMKLKIIAFKTIYFLGTKAIKLLLTTTCAPLLAPVLTNPLNILNSIKFNWLLTALEATGMIPSSIIHLLNNSSKLLNNEFLDFLIKDSVTILPDINNIIAYLGDNTITLTDSQEDIIKSKWTEYVTIDGQNQLEKALSTDNKLNIDSIKEPLTQTIETLNKFFTNHKTSEATVPNNMSINPFTKAPDDKKELFDFCKLITEVNTYNCNLIGIIFINGYDLYDIKNDYDSLDKPNTPVDITVESFLKSKMKKDLKGVLNSSQLIATLNMALPDSGLHLFRDSSDNNDGDNDYLGNILSNIIQVPKTGTFVSSMAVTLVDAVIKTDDIDINKKNAKKSEKKIFMEKIEMRTNLYKQGNTKQKVDELIAEKFYPTKNEYESYLYNGINNLFVKSDINTLRKFSVFTISTYLGCHFTTAFSSFFLSQDPVEFTRTFSTAQSALEGFDEFLGKFIIYIRAYFELGDKEVNMSNLAIKASELGLEDLISGNSKKILGIPSKKIAEYLNSIFILLVGELQNIISDTTKFVGTHFTKFVNKQKVINSINQKRFIKTFAKYTLIIIETISKLFITASTSETSRTIYSKVHNFASTDMKFNTTSFRKTLSYMNKYSSIISLFCTKKKNITHSDIDTVTFNAYDQANKLTFTSPPIGSTVSIKEAVEKKDLVDKDSWSNWLLNMFFNLTTGYDYETNRQKIYYQADMANGWKLTNIDGNQAVVVDEKNKKDTQKLETDIILLYFKEYIEKIKGTGKVEEVEEVEKYLSGEGTINLGDLPFFTDGALKKNFIIYITNKKDGTKASEYLKRLLMVSLNDKTIIEKLEAVTPTIIKTYNDEADTAPGSLASDEKVRTIDLQHKYNGFFDEYKHIVIPDSYIFGQLDRDKCEFNDLVNKNLRDLSILLTDIYDLKKPDEKLSSVTIKLGEKCNTEEVKSLLSEKLKKIIPEPRDPISETFFKFKNASELEGGEGETFTFNHDEITNMSQVQISKHIYSRDPSKFTVKVITFDESTTFNKPHYVTYYDTSGNEKISISYTPSKYSDIYSDKTFHENAVDSLDSFIQDSLQNETKEKLESLKKFYNKEYGGTKQSLNAAGYTTDKRNREIDSIVTDSLDLLNLKLKHNQALQKKITALINQIRKTDFNGPFRGSSISLDNNKASYDPLSSPYYKLKGKDSPEFKSKLEELVTYFKEHPNRFKELLEKIQGSEITEIEESQINAFTVLSVIYHPNVVETLSNISNESHFLPWNWNSLKKDLNGLTKLLTGKDIKYTDLKTQREPQLPLRSKISRFIYTSSVMSILQGGVKSKDIEWTDDPSKFNSGNPTVTDKPSHPTTTKIVLYNGDDIELRQLNLEIIKINLPDTPIDDYIKNFLLLLNSAQTNYNTESWDKDFYEVTLKALGFESDKNKNKFDCLVTMLFYSGDQKKHTKIKNLCDEDGIYQQYITDPIKLPQPPPRTLKDFTKWLKDDNNDWFDFIENNSNISIENTYRFNEQKKEYNKPGSKGTEKAVAEMYNIMHKEILPQLRKNLTDKKPGSYYLESVSKELFKTLDKYNKGTIKFEDDIKTTVNEIIEKLANLSDQMHSSMNNDVATQQTVVIKGQKTEEGKTNTNNKRVNQTPVIENESKTAQKKGETQTGQKTGEKIGEATGETTGEKVGDAVAEKPVIDTDLIEEEKEELIEEQVEDLKEETLSALEQAFSSLADMFSGSFGFGNTNKGRTGKQGDPETKLDEDKESNQAKLSTIKKCKSLYQKWTPGGMYREGGFEHIITHNVISTEDLNFIKQYCLKKNAMVEGVDLLNKVYSFMLKSLGVTTSGMLQAIMIGLKAAIGAGIAATLAVISITIVSACTFGALGCAFVFTGLSTTISVASFILIQKYIDTPFNNAKVFLTTEAPHLVNTSAVSYQIEYLYDKIFYNTQPLDKVLVGTTFKYKNALYKKGPTEICMILSNGDELPLTLLETKNKIRTYIRPDGKFKMTIPYNEAVIIVDETDPSYSLEYILGLKTYEQEKTIALPKLGDQELLKRRILLMQLYSIVGTKNFEDFSKLFGPMEGINSVPTFSSLGDTDGTKRLDLLTNEKKINLKLLKKLWNVTSFNDLRRGPKTATKPGSSGDVRALYTEASQVRNYKLFADSSSLYSFKDGIPNLEDTKESMKLIYEIFGDPAETASKLMPIDLEGLFEGKGAKIDAHIGKVTMEKMHKLNELAIRFPAMEKIIFGENSMQGVILQSIRSSVYNGNAKDMSFEDFKKLDSSVQPKALLGMPPDIQKIFIEKVGEDNAQNGEKLKEGVANLGKSIISQEISKELEKVVKESGEALDYFTVTLGLKCIVVCLNALLSSITKCIAKITDLFIKVFGYAYNVVTGKTLSVTIDVKDWETKILKMVEGLNEKINSTPENNMLDRHFCEKIFGPMDDGASTGIFQSGLIQNLRDICGIYPKPSGVSLAKPHPFFIDTDYLHKHEKGYKSDSSEGISQNLLEIYLSGLDEKSDTFDKFFTNFFNLSKAKKTYYSKTFGNINENYFKNLPEDIKATLGTEEAKKTFFEKLPPKIKFKLIVYNLSLDDEKCLSELIYGNESHLGVFLNKFGLTETAFKTKVTDYVKESENSGGSLYDLCTGASAPVYNHICAEITGLQVTLNQHSIEGNLKTLRTELLLHFLENEKLPNGERYILSDPHYMGIKSTNDQIDLVYIDNITPKLDNLGEGTIVIDDLNKYIIEQIFNVKSVSLFNDENTNREELFYGLYKLANKHGNNSTDYQKELKKLAVVELTDEQANILATRFLLLSKYRYNYFNKVDESGDDVKSFLKSVKTKLWEKYSQPQKLIIEPKIAKGIISDEEHNPSTYEFAIIAESIEGSAIKRADTEKSDTIPNNFVIENIAYTDTQIIPHSDWKTRRLVEEGVFLYKSNSEKSKVTLEHLNQKPNTPRERFKKQQELGYAITEDHIYPGFLHIDYKSNFKPISIDSKTYLPIIFVDCADASALTKPESISEKDIGDDFLINTREVGSRSKILYIDIKIIDSFKEIDTFKQKYTQQYTDYLIMCRGVFKSLSIDSIVKLFSKQRPQPTTGKQPKLHYSI